MARERGVDSLDVGTKRLLDRLHDRGLNFDPERRDAFTEPNGWEVDEYRRPLPAEQPGPPEPGGSWEIARRLVRDYEFADPSIVRAVWSRDAPLEGRDMLLEIRFWGIRFRVGVRVGGVTDGSRDIEGQPVRIWGWNYRTLQGHLEMGEMDYEVWKWTGTGAVEFRIHRVARTAVIPNPLIRLGVAVFGRRLQERFVRRACDRVSSMVEAELGAAASEPATRHARGGSKGHTGQTYGRSSGTRGK